MFDFLKSMFGTSSDEVQAFIDRGAVIIDVREVAEFNSGHYPEAVNIPLSELGRHIDKLKAADKLIVAYCRSGNRSGVAARMLRDRGLEVINGGGLHDMMSLIS